MTKLAHCLSLVAVFAGLTLPAWPQTTTSTPTATPLYRVKTDTVTGAPLATTGPTGFTPAQVRKFYGFDLITNTGSGQTIGIVTAYDNPNLAADLATFNTKFALPACTTATGCLKIVYATGTKPVANSTWALEASLDVQWSHAIAPAAKIVVVEAASNAIADLMTAVDVAVANGANVVTMSFGTTEVSTETSNDSHFAVAKVTFVAASGDSGTGVRYPAVSPYVLSVGGTKMTAADTKGTFKSETAWSGSGGGRSLFELIPSYQSGYPIPSATSYRGQPDVSYGADPTAGFSVYDSVAYNGSTGWFVVAGTSAGSPQWAALAAIANSLRVAAAKQPLNATSTSSINTLLYKIGASATYATNYRDITSGTNGTCGTLCTAATGYDYVTGLGSPKANVVINSLVAQP